MKVNKLENVDFDKIILLGIEEVYGFDRATGELAFAFDQIKSGELSGANDVSYAEGKRGVRLATMKTNKTSSFTCENGYVIFSALGRQIGAEVERAYADSTPVTEAQSEVLVKAGGATLTLSHTPLGDTLKVFAMVDGAPQKKPLTKTTDYDVSGTTITLKSSEAAKPMGTEYLCTYDATVTKSDKIDVNRVELVGCKSHKLTLAGTPKEGTFKIYSTNVDQTQKAQLLSTDYQQEGKTVTLKGTQGSTPDGTIYLCTYDEALSVAKRIVNDGETFSDDVRLVINMLGQDICSGVQYLVQCIMPKATVSGEWNLSLGTDPAVHNFSAEASLDVCSIEKELCEFIVC